MVASDHFAEYTYANGAHSQRLVFPAYNPKVFRTNGGVPYLKEPGVVLLAQPVVELAGIQGFLDGFDTELNFGQYLEDPVELFCGDQLVKFAGQLCYASFSPNRTMNRDAARYFANLRDGGHGSTHEHPTYSFLIYGVDRSFTHELVRHRVGVAYSQVSQRYVDGKCLRFVERPEYQTIPDLHEMFETWIDYSAQEYAKRAERLLQVQTAGEQLLSAESKRDARKKVNQAARSCLPNEAEAPIVVSGNIRAIRHIIEMRANAHADIQFRIAAVRIAGIMSRVSGLFVDHRVEALSDGTQAIATNTRKI